MLVCHSSEQRVQKEYVGIMNETRKSKRKYSYCFFFKILELQTHNMTQEKVLVDTSTAFATTLTYFLVVDLQITGRNRTVAQPIEAETGADSSHPASDLLALVACTPSSVVYPTTLSIV